MKVNEIFFLFSTNKRTLSIYREHIAEMKKFMIVEPWQYEDSIFVEEFGKIYCIIECLVQF